MKHEESMKTGAGSATIIEEAAEAAWSAARRREGLEVA